MHCSVYFLTDPAIYQSTRRDVLKETGTYIDALVRALGLAVLKMLNMWK